MLLYGIFGIFLWVGLYFFNVCISIFYHIVNIPQLFRTSSEENNKQWESMENINFIRITKLILFFFLWIPIGALSAFVMPAFFTLYGLISPLFAKYDIKNSKNDNNVLNFLYSNLVYKKFFFFVLATLSLFSNGIKYLGNNAIIGIIVAVIFAYLMGLYTNEMPEPGDIDGFSLKIRQQTKQCKVFERDNNDPKLVETCDPIPINDNKIEKLITRGRRRGLTKPREVEGGGDYENVEEQISNDKPDIPPEIITQPRDESIYREQGDFETPTTQLELLKELEKELSEIEQSDVGYQKQDQIGGRKHRKPNVNKKYNIRWT